MRGPVSGAAFLKAAIAGFKVGPRVGLALHGIEMLSRGWHSGAVFGIHAAAATAGSVLRPTAAQFEDTLGMAGTRSSGLMAAQFGAMSRRMHHGFAARSGVYAAWLAADGYTGIKRVFEEKYGGYLVAFGEGHDPDASQVSKDLRRHWETDRIVRKYHTYQRSATILRFPTLEVVRIGTCYELISDVLKRQFGIELPADPGRDVLPSGHLREFELVNGG